MTEGGRKRGGEKGRRERRERRGEGGEEKGGRRGGGCYLNMHIASSVGTVISKIGHIAVVENGGGAEHPTGEGQADDGGEGEEAKDQFD